MMQPPSNAVQACSCGSPKQESRYQGSSLEKIEHMPCRSMCGKLSVWRRMSGEGWCSPLYHAHAEGAQKLAGCAWVRLTQQRPEVHAAVPLAGMSSPEGGRGGGGARAQAERNCAMLVNTCSAAARSFYLRSGFREVGAQPMLIGKRAHWWLAHPARAERQGGAEE